MSTIDTSTWSPDSDLNVEIEGIPLNADAGIAQTWKAVQILMAAHKGDAAAVMTGATANSAGTSGLVPAPSAGDQDKALKGNGTWGSVASASHTHGASDISSGTIDAARLPISSGTGWLRLPGNIQLCWGTESISGNPDVVNYAKSFASTPALTVTAWTNAHFAQVYTCGSGKFSCRIVDRSGSVVTSGFTVFYIAIGTYTS